MRHVTDTDLASEAPQTKGLTAPISRTVADAHLTFYFADFRAIALERTRRSVALGGTRPLSQLGLPMQHTVSDNPKLNRFEMIIGDGELAAAYYRIESGHIVLIHTEVPFERAGEGLGNELAAGVFSLIRDRGQKAVLKCTFMGSYVAKHPENFDVVAG